MFESRLKRIRLELEKGNMDAVLVSSVASIGYLSGYANFSVMEREAYIFIGKNFAYLITDGRYTEAVRKEVSHLTIFERRFGNSTEKLFKKHQSEVKILGVEEDNLTVSEYKRIKKHFKNIKHFNVNNLRSIKSSGEINNIKKACQIGDMAYKYIIKKIKPAVTEEEIAEELASFIRRKGGQMSFPSIVAFGKNSSIPHHQTGNTELKDGNFVLLDFGVKFENYCSDMTRTIFFGEPSQKQKEIYKIVLRAQQKAVEFINKQLKSGKKIMASEVDKIARDFIISKDYPTIPHSLGHGIGLAVHEHPYLSPKSKDELGEGMVFSIEPGIYILNFGGVRIEDLYILKKNGIKQITNSPKELIVI